HHPGGGGGAPPDVAGRSRPRGRSGDHADPRGHLGGQRPGQEGVGAVASVVDQHDRGGPRSRPGRQPLEQGHQGPPTDGGDHDVVGRGLRRPAHARRRRRGIDEGGGGSGHPVLPNMAPRRTRKGPSTSRSMGAEPKHSRASWGSSTIGRPDVLRLVLISTGTPVRASNRSSSSATSGSSAPST